MANPYLAEYQSKRISADQAAALVKSGDYVEFGYCLSKAIAMDMALARRTHELFDVNVHCSKKSTLPRPIPGASISPTARATVPPVNAR